MNLRRTAAGIAIGLGLAGVALAAYVLNELRGKDVLFLQTCTQGSAWPGSGTLCEFMLYRFHPTRDEVHEMNQKAGAGWALSMTDDAQARRLLKHYIAAGVSIDAVDQQHPEAGWTALQLAATGSDPRGVRLLLEAGAAVDAKDAKGRTALDLARLMAGKYPQDPDHAEIVRMLEEAGQGR